MALIKWEPRRTEPELFRGLRQEVDDLFDDFFRRHARLLPSQVPNSDSPF